MKNTVTQDQINKIMQTAEVKAIEVFGKCTIVTAKLPNGFILTESSACVDPANYDVEIGKEICLNRIANRVWELEGYLLQEANYRLNK